MEKEEIEKRKNKLLESLQGEDVSDKNRRYIEAVVRYIDENMSRDVDIETYINEALRVVGKIKGHTTGISEIDDNVDPVLPYVNNYISAISPNGGVYLYVLGQYSESQMLEEASNKPEKAKKGDLRKSLRKQDIGKVDREYIESVAKYIDEKMGDVADIGEYRTRMIEIVSSIKRRATGVSEIDSMQGDVAPYVDNYISIITTSGGMYSHGMKAYRTVEERKTGIQDLGGLVQPVGNDTPVVPKGTNIGARSQERE